MILVLVLVKVIAILYFLLDITNCQSSIILNQITKIYPKNYIFFTKSIRVLNNINLILNQSISLFLGVSGSGKSTLGQVIINKIPITKGYIQYQYIDNNNSNSNSNSNIIPNSCYMDIFYSSTYDSNQPIMKILQSCYIPKQLDNIIQILERYIDIYQTPNQCLLSQRRIFEIGLSILLCYKSKQQYETSPLLIIDELMDKDYITTHHIIHKVLLDFIITYNLQVIFITHSKKLWNEYQKDSITVILDNGNIISSLPSHRVTLPYKLLQNMID